MVFKNLDSKPDFCQMFVIAKKKYKCKKNYGLPYGVCLFVTFTSRQLDMAQKSE